MRCWNKFSMTIVLFSAFVQQALFICFNALITKSQLKYERGEIIIQQSSLPDLIGQSRKKIDFPVKPEWQQKTNQYRMAHGLWYMLTNLWNDVLSKAGQRKWRTLRQRPQGVRNWIFVFSVIPACRVASGDSLRRESFRLFGIARKILDKPEWQK